MHEVLEIHEFFVEGKNQERSHVLLHITEPGTPEEMSKGYFFAVAEINNGSIEQIEHLQQMIDDLESGYYETEDQPDKNAFEITLEFINRRGHHVLQYHNALTNCLVGVLRGHELYFAYHGFPQAQLFYTNKQELNNLDILAGQTNSQSKDQLFSSMLQGAINEGDYFYVATPHVVDYFTTDRLIKILNSKNTRQSAEHVQKVLADLNDELSFGGLLLHFPTQLQIPKTGKQLKTPMEKGSEASLNDMLNQERNTAEILSPPLLKNAKNKWFSFLNDRKIKKQDNLIIQPIVPQTTEMEITKKGSIETNFRQRENETSESLTNTLLIAIGKGIISLIVGIYKLLKNIIVYGGKGLLILFILISNKGGQREIIIKNSRQKIIEKRESLNQLPLISKVLMIFTFVLAIIFVGSLAYFKIKKNNEIKQQNYNNQTQAILDKKTAADASLINSDENRAFTLLQEAKNDIEQLSQDNKTEKNKALELQKEIDASLMKLRKLYTISPSLMVDLGSVNPAVQAQKLIRIDQNLIAYGENDKNFYKINLATNQTEQKDHNNIPRLLSADTPKEQDKIVFLSGPNTVASFNKETSLISNIDTTFPGEGVSLANLFIYSQKLYTLDPANNQIYKHNPTQTGFDKGANWLKNTETDIRDGISFAIDGDLFLLKRSGEIFKFTSGVKQDFTVNGLDPKLDNPTILWTYNGIKNLYILEPTNKRVVVLDKTGKLFAQYTAIGWKSPTGIVVDESAGIIYVLDSNKVYKFNLNK